MMIGMCSSVVMLMMVMMMMMYMYMYINLVIFIEWSIFNFNGMIMSVIFLLDWMSLMFICVVLTISSSVMMYSLAYMKEDKSLNRFFILVLLFILSMLFLIISPSFITILLGWDGLGLVSYCLVIYYHNNKSSSAGMLTILSNRIGDVGLLISIGLLFSYGSWSMLSMNLEFESILWLVVIFILLAGMTKSAQIPFSAWLPAAMAAPTPVSALVHSSTLVTAGIYLLIRFYWIYSNLQYIKNFMLIMSLLTMLCAGIVAMYEYDFKKIIALSTLSQLGLMMFILAMGYPIISFFHLVVHAMFKALIFLCAGKIIHETMGIQDIRFMGNISYFSPLMSMSFLLANLSLCGFPFLAGFYSKDMILETFIKSDLNFFILIFLMMSISLTCLYSIRVTIFVMLSNLKFLKLYKFNENEWFYLFPLCLLSMTTLIMGISVNYYSFWEMNYLSLFYMEKIWPLIMFFFIIYLFIYYKFMMNKNYLQYINFFFSSMWYLTLMSSQWLMYNLLYESKVNFQMSDSGWMEMIGSTGIWKMMMNLFMFINFFQNNSFKNLFFGMMMFLLLLYFIL